MATNVLDSENSLPISPVKRLRRSKSQSKAQIYVDDLIEDFFTCCICFDDIKRCHMTQCGHNFCEVCIKECLDRKHKCPLCQNDVKTEELIRNVHLDSTLAKLNEIKQESAQHYVSTIVQKSISESKHDAPNAAESPISQIFTKYTAQTLVKYETYYQDMMRDILTIEHRLQEQLRKDLIPLIPCLNNISIMNNNVNNDTSMNNNNNNSTITSTNELFLSMLNANSTQDSSSSTSTSSGSTGTTINSSKYFSLLNEKMGIFSSHIEKEYSNVNEKDIKSILARIEIFGKQMNLTQTRFTHSCELLFKSFENYMKSVAPAPFLLPIHITVRLKKRNQFWDLQLKSTDRIGVIINVISKKFNELGDPIYQWKFNDNSESDNKENEENSNHNKYMLGLLRPLHQRNLDEPLQIISNMEQCVSELNIRQGTQIHILTEFTLESEAPRPCFTYNFEKDKDMKSDYYKCKTCDINWVCQPCSIQCHKGHELIEFYMDFAPSYACCYCMKKKKCIILNSKSKK